MVVNVAGGGTGGEDFGDGKYICRVIDFDGSIIKEQHLDSGEVFTLPETPIRDRLTFQEWSSPFEIVDNAITVTDCDIIICAIYETTSGKNEFDIVLNKATGLTVKFSSGYAGVKDWGDGTSDSLTSHTYSDYGAYTIIATKTSIPNSSSVNIFGGGTTGSNYDYSCVAVRISSGATMIGNITFKNCKNLKYVSLPNTITRIGEDAFMGTPVYFVGFPNSISTFGSTQLDSSTKGVMDSCVFTKDIIIPTKITQLTRYSFGSLYNLETCFIPPNINAIGPNNFLYIYRCKTVYFTKHTSVPTLSSSAGCFTQGSNLKIVVPDSLYDAWIGTTNWSALANKIYKASEV